MTARILVRIAALIPLGLTGCASMSETGKGAVGGSLIGSAVGTGIGLATKNPLAGAAIGGLAGAGIGGAIGAEKDEKARERADLKEIAQAEAQVARRGPLAVAEVIQLSQPDATGKKMSDGVIIDYLRSTGSTFRLTPGDLRDLNAAGVSDPVIQEMLSSANRVPPPTRVVVREPRPVVVYERPYYDPWGPVYYRPAPVAVGFSYNRFR